MTKYLPFYFDREGYLTNQKAFIITGENIETLTAFCNSSLFKYAYSNNFPELQGGTRELSKVFFEELVVRKPSATENQDYLELINEIQTNKKLNKETELLEKKLNTKILSSYKLTDIEIQAVETSIGP